MCDSTAAALLIVFLSSLESQFKVQCNKSGPALLIVFSLAFESQPTCSDVAEI